MNHKFHFIQVIAEERSISKAAIRLFVSQPYLSKTLGEIESSLHVKLFKRGKKYLQITPAGERFLQYIQDANHLEEQMLLDIAEIQNSGAGSFGVGISPSRVPYIIPYVIPQFKTRFPHTEVLISENHYSKILEDILNGQIQIGIISPLMNLNRITIEPISEEALLLILPPGHVFGTKEAQGNYAHPPRFDASHFHQLCKSPCVTTKKGLGLSILVQRIINEQNVGDVHFIEVNSVDTIFKLVLEGSGFAFIPSSGVRNFPLRDQAFYYTFGDPPFKWRQVFAYRSDTAITPAMRYFMELAKAIYLENRQ